jgi:hypothetical protein
MPLKIPYISILRAGLNSVICQNYLAPQTSIFLDSVHIHLAQPMDWMESEVDNREHQGVLDCPE